MLYITWYSVIGSRCNGSYLVNAKSKREANSIVKRIDVDYARISSQTKEEFGDDLGWDDMISDITMPGEGEAVQIECGT